LPDSTKGETNIISGYGEMPGDYYFFCLSYSNVPAILSVVDGLDAGGVSIHIIVHMESHRLFWEELVKSKNLNWEVISIDTGAPERLYNPVSWFRVRRSIRQTYRGYFQALHGAQIYFFSLIPPLPVLTLIKRLAGKSSIYFLDCDKRVFPEWHSVKNEVYRILVRLLYAVKVNMVRVADGAAPMLSRDFLNSAGVSELNGQHFYNPEVLRRYDFITGERDEIIRLVLLDDDCFIYEIPASGVAYGVVSNTKKIIDANFQKSEVIFKRHPNPAFHTRQFGAIYEGYSEYPYYVPADFMFLNTDIKFVVGGFSTTLAIASKRFGVRAVSYLKLVTLRDEAFKEQMVDILKTESDDKIAFPESWEELGLLLSPSPEKTLPVAASTDMGE